MLKDTQLGGARTRMGTHPGLSGSIASALATNPKLLQNISWRMIFKNYMGANEGMQKRGVGTKTEEEKN